MQHILETAGQVLPYVAGGYEVIARSIPTKRDCSIIGNVLKFLLAISSVLDNKKKDEK